MSNIVHTRRLPAEWEEHEACWLAWPSHAELWGEELPDVRASVARLCREVGAGERIELLCRTDGDERAAREALAETDVRYHRIPYGDIWLRDTAPLFVQQDGERDGALACARFRFNGWGGKYLLEDDSEVSARVAKAAGLPSFELPIVLEGGAIDGDGEGTFLTTRQCLLNPNRNPGLDEAAYFRHLSGALGAEAMIWLDDGLKNDHTDGHVDTVARFVAPGVVACMEPAPDDPNRDALLAIIDEVSSAIDAQSRAVEVALVPSPGAVTDAGGALMPASYLNFLIANDCVAVPVYGAAADDDAAAAIEALFPGRRVVTIDARAILGGGGAFHCITQQQPCPRS